MSKLLTRNEFILKAGLKHNFKYTYHLVNYINSRTKVNITCTNHGVFIQAPAEHLYGKGCPACSGNIKLSLGDILEKALEVHGNLYDYSRVEYKNARTPIEIVCDKHGSFFQTTDNHINKYQGCPSCASSGFNVSKPAILYYLKINGGEAYKIGITNRSVSERFSTVELNNIEVLSVTKFALGLDALQEEQRILKEFNDFKYVGEPLLLSGNTELFTKDILEKEE